MLRARPGGIDPVKGISLCAGTYYNHLSDAQARLFLTLCHHALRSYQRTAEGTLAARVSERFISESTRARWPW